jgi:indolepyruvate ferredoxin oxidoreductase, beta subunit
MAVTNILIVGVGGQGTLLASRVMGNLGLQLGHDVKLSEVHGMAQRGGSVVTHVRFGDKVYAPVIDAGQADIILAFEKLEAYRWMHFLKKGGKMFVNDQTISPMPVVIGTAEYPKGINEKISDKADVIYIDALKIAKEAGNKKAVNIVLIGVLANNMDIEKDVFIAAIKSTVPEKFLDINLKAFEMGYNA